MLSINIHLLLIYFILHNENGEKNKLILTFLIAIVILRLMLYMPLIISAICLLFEY